MSVFFYNEHLIFSIDVYACIYNVLYNISMNSYNHERLLDYTTSVDIAENYACFK